MAVRRGTSTPSAVFRGTVPVKKIMRGIVEVWSATPPSVYPVSGTWNSALTATATTYASHTIAEAGSYTLTYTVTGGGQYVTAAIDGPWGVTNGAVGPPSTVTVTRTLAAGDVIRFQAVSFFPSGTASGSWSITKEALTVITVTPQAPTFLTESPWYTLPTQAGVTYTVSGTPGYGQSVTVTATAQAGYALAGQTSWTHTYGPAPSIYPVSGEWSYVPAANTVTHAAHTIEEPGTYTLTHTVTLSDGGSVNIRIRGTWGNSYGYPNTTPSTHTTTQTLAVGDVVEFGASYYRSGGTSSGSWSIVKK